MKDLVIISGTTLPQSFLRGHASKIFDKVAKDDDRVPTIGTANHRTSSLHTIDSVD